MSLTLTLEVANVYFGDENHARSSVWEGFDDPARRAALAHATRIISRALQTDVTGESVDASTFYRPDYAVFEQALHLLVNSRAIPNGEQSAPHWAGSDGDTESSDDGSSELIHPEAMAYINARPVLIMLSRG